MSMRVVRPAMGTMVTVDLRDELPEPALAHAAAAFFEVLETLERRFSPWLPDSEISRIGRGELDEAEAAVDTRWVLAVCDHLERATAGAFSARRGLPAPRLDPSALVKGWAVDEAASVLLEAGLSNVCINAGGDVLAWGAPATGRRWRVGLRHPDRADRLTTVLELDHGAVATSGLYERGDHIRDARTGAAVAPFRSLTVVGPALGWADAYATAAFVMGPGGLDWVAEHPGYGAIAVARDNHLVWTPEAARHLTNFSGSGA